MTKVADNANDFVKNMLGNANTVSNDWLYTEQNTAGKIANSMEEWNTIQDNKALFPLLEYDAIVDGRTREEHEALNGTVLPVDDPFWSDFMPPNGYNCRCLVIPTIEGSKDITDRPKVSKEDVKPLWRNNPGKSGKIFTTNHPYLNNTTTAQRRSNFGLGFPNTITKITEVIKPVVTKPKPVAKPKPKKVEPKEVELEGFQGKWEHGNLKGVALENQKKVEDFVGFKIPDKLVSKIKTPITVKDGSPSYDFFKKELSLGKNISKSPTRATLISHELGHATHFATDEVNVFFSSDKFKKIKENFKKELFDKYEAATIKRGFRGRKLTENHIWKYVDDQLDFDLRQAWKLDFRESQIAGDPIVNLRDTIGGMTKGAVGKGHKVSYYKSGNLSNAEIFAHFSENYFTGNKQFKKWFPKTYKESIKYIDTILDE
jgi:SPP1 gp7 family putative phage head morphogenesis protein